MTRIAILGPEGTVSEEAAEHLFADMDVELIPYRLISEVFTATAEGHTDYSVIPIENTIEGSVSLHMDWLIHEVDLPIQAEWVYPPRQNLIGFAPSEASSGNASAAASDVHPEVSSMAASDESFSVSSGFASDANSEISTGTASDAHSRVTSGAASDERSGESAGEKDRLAAKLAGIRKVMSHPVAIAQSSQFLKKYLPHAELEHVSSTAEGVRLVKTSGDAGIAAIGTVLAARRYGLQVLAEDIQDHKNNFTRFILVGKQPIQIKSTDTYKTSLQVTLPEDYPGALHQVLSAFAWRRINLTRIESRPTRKKLGSYYFLIDIMGSLDSVLLPAAISEIEAIGCQVRILGSYPSYSYETTQSEV